MGVGKLFEFPRIYVEWAQCYSGIPSLLKICTSEEWAVSLDYLRGLRGIATWLVSRRAFASACLPRSCYSVFAIKRRPRKSAWRRQSIPMPSRALPARRRLQLNIGKSIFFNERINTTTSGLVQVLLVDGSTFTVGPGSDLVINKFVYDPKKGTGQIAASFSKGVMRFVGGKISKQDNAVTINTPAGALAVRGCIILGNIVSASNYGFVCVFCEYMKMKNHVIFENGYGIFNDNGREQTGPATQKIINAMMAGLTHQGQNTAGSDTSGVKPSPNYVSVDALSLQDLVADATQDVLVNTLSAPVTQHRPILAMDRLRPIPLPRLRPIPVVMRRAW